MRWWTADYAELLLELDRVEDAAHLVDVWEADARRVDREWVLAQVSRCRGLVAANRRDFEQAIASFAQALAEHEAVGDPFGRGRTLLALGMVRRRIRQKRRAREAIESAIEAFARVGASEWAEKARAELARVGGRQPGTQVLTTTEQRVAELAAEGRTDKEIAAILFVTPKTVGTKLSRVYAKLGVRSRAELAHLFAHRRTTKV
jgi:DNA-binding CsgD family transcriptional regulator